MCKDAGTAGGLEEDTHTQFHLASVAAWVCNHRRSYVMPGVRWIPISMKSRVYLNEEKMMALNGGRASPPSSAVATASAAAASSAILAWSQPTMCCKMCSPNQLDQD